MDPRVNDEFLDYLNSKYGEHGEVKATRGSIHEYLGMTLDFSVSGKVKINMRKYVAKMLEDFREIQDLSTTAETPAAGNLFDAGSGEELDRARREAFHTKSEDFPSAATDCNVWKCRGGQGKNSIAS